MVVCLLCVLFLFGFVFGVVVAFGSLCFVSCSLTNVTREKDYVSVLYQFTFAATTASAPA